MMGPMLSRTGWCYYEWLPLHRLGMGRNWMSLVLVAAGIGNSVGIVGCDCHVVAVAQVCAR